MTYFSSWIWNEREMYLRKKPSPEAVIMEMTCIRRDQLFQGQQHALSSAGSTLGLELWQFLFAAFTSWATHLVSGCSHPDRGHLPTRGECNQMEGAFPTQLPKAHANHLESLEHDCSSWGGWGSPLKRAGELRNLCSSVKRTGLQYQSGGLKSVPYSHKKYENIT